jgi:GTPase SAR1 family protein
MILQHLRFTICFVLGDALKHHREDHRFLFKVFPVGNAGVGKTSLVRKYTGEKY